MDGIHDLGGRQGYGTVEVTGDEEATFLEPWEGRLLAMARAMTNAGWNLDKFRYTREQLPPEEYLSRPYYDQWYRTYAAMVMGAGLVTPHELAEGRSIRDVTAEAAGLPPAMTRADVDPARVSGVSYKREFDGQPAFAVGANVTARQHGHTGHTRLPQYVRGHTGSVIAYRGAHLVPDEGAAGREIAEPLYTVAFPASDLFPERAASPDRVLLDLWERYLVPA